jgi:hypothetical protein
MSLLTWAETSRAQPRSRGAPAPRSWWRWPADSDGDRGQGEPGRGARATEWGGESTGGVSGRRAHRSGLSTVGGVESLAGEGHRQARGGGGHGRRWTGRQVAHYRG